MTTIFHEGKERALGTLFSVGVGGDTCPGEGLQLGGSDLSEPPISPFSCGGSYSSSEESQDGTRGSSGESSDGGSSSSFHYKRMSRQIEQETRVEWSDSGHSSSESSSSSTECGSLERLERVLEEEELLERTSEVTKEPRAARTVCVWNTGFANVIPFRRALRSACIRREDGAIVGFDWEEDCVVEAHGVSERRLARIVTQITMVNQLVNGQIRFDVVCRSVALARWLVGAIDTLPAWNRWFGRLHIANPKERTRRTSGDDTEDTGRNRDHLDPEGRTEERTGTLCASSASSLDGTGEERYRQGNLNYHLAGRGRESVTLKPPGNDSSSSSDSVSRSAAAERQHSVGGRILARSSTEMEKEQEEELNRGLVGMTTYDGAIERCNDGSISGTVSRLCLLLMTLNICGLSSKSERLAARLHFLRRRPSAIALQETGRKRMGGSAGLPGYRLIEYPVTWISRIDLSVADPPEDDPCFAGTPEERSRSEFFRSRGLALAISHAEVVTEVWRKPYLVAARVANASGSSYVVMSVYVNPSHGRSVATRILKRIGDFVAKVVQKYPDEAVIAMGDWNRSRSALRTFMRSQWESPLDFTKQAAFMECGDRRGAIRVREPTLQPTYSKGRYQSVLDHILVSPTGSTGPKWKAVTRVRRWDLSDHFPVFCRLEGVKRREDRTTDTEGEVEALGNDDGWERVVANGRKRNLLLKKAFRKASVVESISTSNYWSTLANMLEGSDGLSGEAAINRFTEVLDTVVAQAMPSLPRNMIASSIARNSTSAQKSGEDSGNTGRPKGFDRRRDRMRVGKNGQKNERFPGRITRLLRKRQKAFEKWREAVNNDLGGGMSDALIERRLARLRRHDKFVKHAIHTHRGEQWVRYVQGWVDGAFPGRASSTVQGSGDDAEDTSDVLTDPGEGPRMHWRGIRAVMDSKDSTSAGQGPRRRGVRGGSTTSLIRHPTTGELITDSAESSQVFMDHWAKLAEDVTGHSQDRAYWRRRRFTNMLHEYPPLPEAELNAPITVGELWTVVHHMKRGKAPGFDGITNELFMVLPLFTEDDDDEGDESLSNCGEGSDEGVGGGASGKLTDLGRVVYQMCQRLFQDGVIPDQYNVATVVPVPKKGDLTDIDNYRGISLINTTIKLVTKIVTDRLSSALEKSGRLCGEQAGFRKFEETHSQITGLYEVLRRRQVQGLTSYVTFVDFAKAYDTVPHEALFLKMEKIGVHGRMLAFFRALYASSSLTVPGGTTRRVPLRRGVRQGCPSSPILFDIFINDFFYEWKDRDLGVADWKRQQQTVVGRRRPREQAEEDVEGRRICGFLFADDACALTETCRDTQKGLKLIGRWADRWEMRVGHRKCGLMRISPTANAARCRQQQEDAQASQRLDGEAAAVERRRELRRWIRASAWAQVQQGRIPIVDEYLYLGCMFNDRLDLDAMAKHRAAFSRLRFEQTQDFLGMTSIPMSIRAKVYKVTVLQTGLYGAELWGMSTVRCQALQRVTNRAIRKIGGHNSAGITPVVSWGRELQIPPVALLAAERRLRAYTKFKYGGPDGKGVRTQIKLLLDCKPPSLRFGRTWTSGVELWVKAHGGVAARELIESCRTLQKDDVRAIRKEWWMAADDRVTKNGRHVRHADYLLFSMTETAPVIRQLVSRHVELAKGATLLMQCRTGTLWTGSRLAAIDYLPSNFKKQCPCCGRGVYAYNSEGDIVETGETEAHLLVECAAWDDLRRRFLGDCLSAASRLTETSTGGPTRNDTSSQVNRGIGNENTEDASATRRYRSNNPSERLEDEILDERRLKQIRLLLLGGQLHGLEWRPERMQLESWRRSVRAIAQKDAEGAGEALRVRARALADEVVATNQRSTVASEEGSECSDSDLAVSVRSVPSDAQDVACLSVLRFCQAVRALRYGRINHLIEAHLEGRRARRSGRCGTSTGMFGADGECESTRSEGSTATQQGEKSDSSLGDGCGRDHRPRSPRSSSTSLSEDGSEEGMFTLCCDHCGSPTPNFCPCVLPAGKVAAEDSSSSSLDDIPLLDGWPVRSMH